MKAEERPESAESRTRYRSIRMGAAHKSLYSENYGDTRVSVVGSKRMKVYTDPETGELVIETRDGTIRLQKTDDD